MKVAGDTVVTITYTLEAADGETPDLLKKNFSASFLFGRNQMLPSLEQALSGHDKGDQVEVTIPSSQAFGEYDEKLVNEIPKSQLLHPERLEEGQVYEEPMGNGQMVRFVVKEIRDDSVVGDFNHPAAGKDLTIKATIEDVRAASAMDILAALNMGSGGG